MDTDTRELDRTTLLGRRVADSLDPVGRPIDRLRFHYEIERELAQRLREAPAEARGALYGDLYNELFARVADHPQLTVPKDPNSIRAGVAEQLRMVRAFLAPGGSFLEIGAGDCALSLAVCGYASTVRAIEVSDTIAEVADPPPEFELLITDGTALPVPPGSVDLVYSNQLIEHLHPDDAATQAANIATALRPGGKYICITPHRLLGPADISAFFTRGPAEGFHLREYTTRELSDLFGSAGFSKVHVLASHRGHALELPAPPFLLLDALFGMLPSRLRSRLKRFGVVRKALAPGSGVVAVR